VNPSQRALEGTANHSATLDGPECHPVKTRPLERNLEREQESEPLSTMPRHV